MLRYINKREALPGRIGREWHYTCLRSREEEKTEKGKEILEIEYVGLLNMAMCKEEGKKGRRE